MADALCILQEVMKWKEDLDAKIRLGTGEPLPCLLIANKCDLPERQVSKEEIQQLVDDKSTVLLLMLIRQGSA